MFFRSVFFVPGDSERKIAKSHSIDADLPVFDLEDSVLPKRRAFARESVAAVLHETAARGGARAVRINALDTDDAAKDLAAVVSARPDVIMLPKIRSVRDVNQLDEHLGRLESAEGIEVGSTKILAVATETPEIMFSLGGLQQASGRLLALTWGAEDLSTALGATSNKDDRGNWTFPYQMARSQCLFAARAAGLQPIDTLHGNFRDPGGLKASCQEARRDGFTGKLAIHPDQVPVINESFAPSSAEVDFAQRVIATFESSPDEGAVQLDGRMLDIPHLKQAKALLRQHEYFSARRPDQPET